MKRSLHTLIAFLILAIIMLPFLPQASAGPRSRSAARPPALGPYVPDEVLVKFRPGVNAENAARAVGGRVHSRIDGLNVHLLKVAAGTVEATLRSLERNSLVEYAEPNGYVQAFDHANPNDPYDDPASCPYQSSDMSFTCQWFWAKVQAYDAWHLNTGNCTIVAVVDTGIDVGDNVHYPPDVPPEHGPHPDLHEPACPPTIMASYVAGEPTGNDDHGHGTHVAGTIGAKTNNGLGISGASWKTRQMGVKVLDWLGGGTWSAVASGIRFAVDNVPPAQVINLSLGGNRGSRTLRDAVDYAWNKGAVVVCAAGNAGTTARQYPAFYANCLAVAASDPNDNRPSWSTYGSWVEVAAPGLNILSTMQEFFEWCSLCWLYGYYEGYDTLSGTSMATSVVSGLAALVWASGKCPPGPGANACVRGRIENTTDPVPGGYVSKGRVNFFKALNAP